MIYFNEFDKIAAAWIRELIAAKLIPDGVVDERSIKDVQPADLAGFTQCHFFAGIGGWSRALDLAGYPRGRAIWTGSCPCQPFSAAGKGGAESDPRHLWPDFYRLIRECRPDCVVGEQVSSKDALRWFDGVRLDLEREGYACGVLDTCAAGTGEETEGRVSRGGEISYEPILVGAPHIRQRLYWMADRDGAGREGAGIAGPNGAAEGERAYALNPLRSGTDGRLADSGHGIGGREAIGESGAEVAGHGNEATVPFGRRGPTVGLGDTEGEREGEVGGIPEGPGVVANRSDVGMGNSDSAGLGEQCGAVSVPEEQPAAQLRSDAGHWSRFDLIPCRDGKARRIPAQTQSGVLGVADGLPGGMVDRWLGGHPLTEEKIEGRVGLLRGYGNAIVPAVAAEFIRCVMEVQEFTQDGI